MKCDNCKIEKRIKVRVEVFDHQTQTYHFCSIICNIDYFTRKKSIFGGDLYG